MYSVCFILIIFSLVTKYFFVITLVFDTCVQNVNDIYSIFFVNQKCQSNILQQQDGFNYFILKQDQCTYNLVLNNSLSKESVLYIDDFKYLNGTITLQYLGKLKIIAQGDLYLDNIKFLNVLSVEITVGYEKNNEILPLSFCNHLKLSSVVAPNFYVHDFESVELLGDIISCNLFELRNVSNINSRELIQLLTDEMKIDLANNIYWNGNVSSCQLNRSNIISIKAFYTLKFLRNSKLVSKDLLIFGSNKTSVYVSGILASSNLLSIESNSLNFLDNSKIKSGFLAKFKCENFTGVKNTFFDFHNGLLEFDRAIFNGKIYWDGVLKFNARSKLVHDFYYADISKAILHGTKIEFYNISVLATNKSISGVSQCIWKSQIIKLYNNMEWSKNCLISSDIVYVKACNYLHHKGSVVKANNIEIIIEDDNDNCTNFSFSSHGIIIANNINIVSSKSSKILFSSSSNLKTHSLKINAPYSKLECSGCKITVNGEGHNSINLKKIFVTSEFDIKVEMKKLSPLYKRYVYDCYEPVFVSERCTVKEVESNDKNLLVIQIPYYKKVGSIAIGGTLNLVIQEIVIHNAAFVVDGELKFQAPVNSVNVTATKGFKTIMLAFLSVHKAVRSSSGTGRIVKGEQYNSHVNPWDYFDKYNIALQFELILQREYNECKEGQTSKNTYCPIFVEKTNITRNTDGLQSIFHAKALNGSNISNLSIGDISDIDFAMISNNISDVETDNLNNLWLDEITKHRTLLKNSGLITSLETMRKVLDTDIATTISGDSKVDMLKRHRLSQELALNLDNLGAYKVYSNAEIQELIKKALPDPSNVQLMWNILDYSESNREFLKDDEIILRLFKCVDLEFPIINLANQALSEDLLGDLILATVGKLKGLSGTRLLENLVNNTCTVYDKLQALGAKAGIPLNKMQKELFEVPGIWPFWLTDCPGGHTSCISLELVLNDQSIEKMLPSGAKLNADEHIILDETNLKLDLNGNIIAGSLIKAKLIGNTRVEGRMLASEINYNIDGNLTNVGIISGDKVLCIANNVINFGLIEAKKGLVFQALGNFIAAGFVGSEGSLSMDVAHKLTLLSIKEVALLDFTSFEQVRQNVAHLTSVIAKGALEISASDILNIGAEIVGESVFISTSEKIITVPLVIYNDVVTAEKYFYSSYKNSKIVKPIIRASGKKEKEIISKESHFSKMILNNDASAFIEKEIARIKAKSGTVIIRGKKEIKITGSDVSGAGDVALLSDEGNITVSGLKIWKETIVTFRGGNFFRSWKHTKHIHDEEVFESNIISGGTLHSYSLKDQKWIGSSIKIISLKLAAGNAKHEANIDIVPLQKHKIIEVETKSEYFTIDLHSEGITFYKKENKREGVISIKQHPTIIELENDFLVYTSGALTILDPHLIDKSEDERGNIHVKINAKHINLEAAPEIEATYSYMNKIGVGIGFSVDGGEFSVKGYTFENSLESNFNKLTHKKPAPFRGWIELNSKSYKDAGIVFLAQSLHINADIEVHGVVINEENEVEIKELFETGIKFGIRSNLGAIADSTANIAETDTNRVEGLINSSFQVYKSYVEVLKLLSTGHMISGGAWFYVRKDKSTNKGKVSKPIPTVINVADFKTKSSELHMIGTQVSAYRGYIETKYFSAHAANFTAEKDMHHSFVDTEIPISTTVAPNMQTLLHKATEKSKLYLNANIYVSDRLTLKISGTADLKGVSINAGKLEASFNELILESLQNILETETLGISLGGGISGITNVGPQIQNSNKHVLESLSELLGREYANVVVAHALRLTGAVIANAERDEDGRFTDHGNLTLTVGELFVQHIYDYDKGVTLGAALNIASSKKYSQIDIDVMPTFGSFEKDGFTRSTIGKGSVNVGNCNLDNNMSESKCEDLSKIEDIKESLNRDLDKVQTFKTKHSIKPINGYFSTIDVDKLKEEIIRNKDRNMDFKTVEMFEKEKKLDENEMIDEIFIKNNEENTDNVDQDILNEKLKLVKDNIFLKKIQSNLKDDFGEKADFLLEEGKERLQKRIKNFEYIKEDQYTVHEGILTINLPKVGIIPISVADSFLDIKFNIINDVAIKSKNIFKIGKLFVRLNPTAAASILLYDIGCYLHESGFATKIGEVAQYVHKSIRSAEEYQNQEFEKIKYKVKKYIETELKNEAKQKLAGKGFANPGNNPNDFEPNDKEREPNCEKSESEIWRKLKNYKKETKTNGLTGKKKKFYQWDFTHNDIEVYDRNGIHLGSKNPKTGKMYKGPVPGRTMKLF